MTARPSVSGPCLASLWALWALCPLASLAAAELTPPQQTLLDQQLVPAYTASRPTVVLTAAKQLTGRMTLEQLEAVDQHLQAQGQPDLGSILLTTRTALVWSGGRFDKPAPSVGETLIMVRTLARQAAELDERLRALPVMQGQGTARAAALTDYEPLFWEIEQAAGEAKQALQLAEQVGQLPAARRRAASPLAEAAPVGTARDTLDQLEQLVRDVRLREWELRIQRLGDAIVVLQGSPDAKRRLIAAHAVDQDSTHLETLVPQLQKDPQSFQDSTLGRTGLAEELTQRIALGRELAGDLIAKTRLLYDGIHWWTRGRYGRGTQFFGLLKTPAARTQQAAQHSIYLPRELPENDDPANDYTYPDRRHYYAWFWEERTLVVRQSVDQKPLRSAPRRTSPTYSAPASPPKVTAVPVQIRRLQPGGGSRFGSGFSGGGKRTNMFLTYGDVAFDRLGWTTEDLYKRLGYDPPKRNYSADYTPSRRPATRERTTVTQTYVEPQDPYAIFQLVGFVEYTLALEHLDRLVKSCTEEELAAIEELLSDRPELTVKTNLAASVEPPGTSLAEAPQRPGDDFRRRGLKWITATARAELAAMLLGFGGQDDAFRKLALQYDRDEYRELILDGARGHYWSFAQDPDLPVVLEGKAGVNRALAYFRRALIADGFVRASLAVGPDALTPVQRAELTQWSGRLGQVKQSLARQIAEAFRTTTNVTRE